MMLSGGIMLGIMLIILILVIGLPVLLIVALLGGGADFLRNLGRAETHWSSNMAPMNTSATQQNQPVASPRYCVHCGAGLQAEWTHCPQCGAPIQNVRG